MIAWLAGLAVAAAAQGSPITAMLASRVPGEDPFSATVFVQLRQRVELGMPHPGRPPGAPAAHFRYRLDGGPEVATAENRLTFHGLPAGRRRLEVRLYDDEGRPMGPPEVLEFSVPITEPRR